VKPILCLDFDGVIHSYASGWKGGDVIPDPPTPGAIDFMVAAHDHFNIAIHSSRFRHPGGIEAVREWLVKYGIERGYIATDEQMAGREWDNGAIVLVSAKPAALVTIDDRAITFTGEWPDPAALLAFKPWNRRDEGAAP
jgi:hypothetical protein